jgi:DNA/RNA-binding domain of Phe-tRNA-synthetase-like protein
MIREAKELVLFYKEYKEAEAEYYAAQDAYRNSEAVKRYNQAEKTFKSKTEAMESDKRELLRALKDKQLPIFLDLGEFGVFVSPTREVIVAPIVNEEDDNA